MGLAIGGGVLFSSSALAQAAAPAAEAPAPSASASAPPSGSPEVAAGFYAGVGVGTGQPFGGQTFSGSSKATVVGGLGATIVAGYGFHPNVGVNLSLHYNQVKYAFSDSVAPSPKPDSSGHLLAYGADLRGMIPIGALVAWGSLGVALGSIEVRSTQTIAHGTVSGTVTTDDKVDIKITPVIAFGFEYRVSRNIAIGPQVRWYLTSFDKPCEDAQATLMSGGVTASSAKSECAPTTSSEISPDIIFVGVGATFYQN